MLKKRAYRELIAKSMLITKSMRKKTVIVRKK